MTPARVRASAAAAAAPVALPIPVAGSVQGVDESTCCDDVGRASDAGVLVGEAVGEGAGERVDEGSPEIVEVVDTLLPELGVDPVAEVLEDGASLVGVDDNTVDVSVVDGELEVVVDEELVVGVVHVVSVVVVVVGLVCGVGLVPQMSAGRSPGWHASA